MEFGIELARKSGKRIKYRFLGRNWEEEFKRYENHLYMGL